MSTPPPSTRARIPGAVIVLVTTLLVPSFEAPPGVADTSEGRLAREVVPVAQWLDLSLDPRSDAYDGTTRVQLRVASATRRFALHALELDLRRVELEDRAGPVPLRWAQRDDGRLEIETRRPLEPGPAALFVSFRNDFDRRANGLYRFEHGGRAYLATQFQAIAAREAFPCWDEPAFKIPWTITLQVPLGTTAVSNAPIESARSSASGRTVRFRATPPLPSSLLALAVGPWDRVPLRGLSGPVALVVPRGEGGRGTSAAAVVRRVLPELERWFGSGQPWPKLDLVAVPELVAGAMENPGAIFFRSSILLHDAARFSPAERLDLASVLAHELAHLWFGDLVTLEWWDDLWLNEGFATFVSDEVVPRVYPEAGEHPDWIARLEAAYRRDVEPGAHAIRRPVKASDPPDLLFDELAYEKGAAVLRMVQAWLGRERFRAGVRGYLRRHAHGNATAEDLWRALSDSSGRDVGAVARGFTDRPGVPHVRAELVEPARVRLRVERAAPPGPPAPDGTWIVPVTILAAGTNRLDTLRVPLAGSDTTLALPRPVRWVHPNFEHTGYYRWSLDDASRSALLADVGRLPARSQAALPAALGAMLRAGTLSGTDWVAALRRLGERPRSPALGSALANEAREWRTTFGAGQPGVPAEIQGWLRPTAEAWGTTPSPNEPIARTLARPAVWRALGDAGADDSRDSLWRAWTDAVLDSRAGPPPSMEAVALEGSAWRGDEARFSRLRAAFDREREPARRERWLVAMGSFREPALAARAASLAEDSALVAQDIPTLLDALAGAPDGTDRFVADLERLFPALARRLPDYSLAQLASHWGGCSVERVERGRAFFAARTPRPAGVDDELAKAAASAAACEALRARVGDEIRRALASPR